MQERRIDTDAARPAKLKKLSEPKKSKKAPQEQQRSGVQGDNSRSS